MSEASLIDFILANEGNATTVRPSAEPTYVLIYFSITKTLQLSTSGVLIIAAMIAVSWSDPRLSWNQKLFPFVTTAVPASSIWIPHISLINSASNSDAVIPSTAATAVVQYGGVVSLTFSTQLTATCPLDLISFPFDTQSCTLRFSSFDANLTTPMVTFRSMAASITTLYDQTGEFTLLNISTNSSNGPDYCFFAFCYATLNFTLRYSRQPSYYVTTMIVPAFIITLLMVYAFVIPSESSVKVTVACTLMVSLYTLQQSISRILPATQNVSHLALGMMFSLLLAGGAVALIITMVTYKILGPNCLYDCKMLCKKEEQLAAFSKRNAVIPLTHETSLTEKQLSAGWAIPTLVSESTQSVEQILLQSMQLQQKLISLIEMQSGMTAEANKKDQVRVQEGKRQRALDLVLNLSFLVVFLGIGLACLIFFDTAVP